MTLQIDGVDLVEAVQIAGLVGGIIAMLVIGLLIYWLVRPPRHVREARRRPVELDDSEAEQLLGLIDRMESRLQVLERALADNQDAAEPAAGRLLETADDGPQMRRN